MENRRILIDTSIIIDYLRSKKRGNTTFIKLLNHNNLTISVITVFELLNGATNQEKLNDISIICNELEILNFNHDTALTASTIYKTLKAKNKLIEIRDILIAATALSSNLNLSTLNKKHFERIENLKLL